MFFQDFKVQLINFFKSLVIKETVYFIHRTNLKLIDTKEKKNYEFSSEVQTPFA